MKHIPYSIFQTETALIHDAVHVFAAALASLDQSQEVAKDNI